MVDATSHISSSRSRTASDALGLWEPKRTLTLAAARRHTQRVQFLRRALIAAAAALTLILVIYFATQGTNAPFEDDPDTSVKMINPRYSGRTSDGLPFYLTSDTATRELEARNEVSLDNPVLEFIRAEGAESSYVEALGGMYDDVEKVLDLRNQVVLETDDGYRCTTTHARIFAREKRIEGDEPIECTGNFGVVRGTTYEVTDNYRTFTFKDGMDGTINQDPAAANDDAFGFGGDGPIEVEADRAVYYGGTTDLFGDIVVVQSGATVYSDEMTILRERADDLAASSIRLGPVTQITGTGNFRYVSEDNDITGDRGLYERAENRITITGDVEVVQPSGNTVSTDRLVYDTSTEQVRFSGQCQGRVCEGNEGRVGITIRQ